MNDFVGLVFWGLVSLEFALELVREIPLIFILLDRRMGILVGESRPNFRLTPSLIT